MARNHRRGLETRSTKTWVVGRFLGISLVRLVDRFFLIGIFSGRCSCHSIQMDERRRGEKLGESLLCESLSKKKRRRESRQKEERGVFPLENGKTAFFFSVPLFLALFPLVSHSSGLLAFYSMSLSLLLTLRLALTLLARSRPPREVSLPRFRDNAFLSA